MKILLGKDEKMLMAEIERNTVLLDPNPTNAPNTWRMTSSRLCWIGEPQK